MQYSACGSAAAIGQLGFPGTGAYLTGQGPRLNNFYSTVPSLIIACITAHMAFSDVAMGKTLYLSICTMVCMVTEVLFNSSPGSESMLAMWRPMSSN
jgi:hypothetical protein